MSPGLGFGPLGVDRWVAHRTEVSPGGAQGSLPPDGDWPLIFAIVQNKFALCRLLGSNQPQRDSSCQAGVHLKLGDFESCVRETLERHAVKAYGAG